MGEVETRLHSKVLNTCKENLRDATVFNFNGNWVHGGIIFRPTRFRVSRLDISLQPRLGREYSMIITNATQTALVSSVSWASFAC